MGQTASTIDNSDPNPDKFSYARAELDTVDIDKINLEGDDDSVSSDEETPAGDDAEENIEVGEEKTKPMKLKVPRKNGKKTATLAAKEDAIDQEQEKQDLLAYLEIVGEHSSQLPYTWRDDPQLGRTVTTLTSKEYAKKADAFIPCDIRIIGASSCNLDRTSDRQIEDAMNIDAKAVEPGKSTGLPISNTLLKALYDFENGDVVLEDDQDDNIDYGVDDNLFEDDDASINEDESFGSLQFEETAGTATLSWSTLIRKMKDEMEDQGYEQVPILTTSRKFDLNEPVHLLPFDFNPKLNRKFALLIGCNYKGKFGELQNSHNDIKVMKDYVVNVHGFPEDDDYMTVLLDDGKHQKPTHQNILIALKDIAIRSRPGDAVFIQFAGHGGRILDSHSGSDTYDETFAPLDFKRRGLISEKSIIRSLLVRMAEDVTVTMLLDSCDSGFVFDMPYSWETKRDNGETLAKLTLNDNFSFVRFLDVVKQMYDANPDGVYNDESSDDEDAIELERKKNTLVHALGATFKDVARDAETELYGIAKKTQRIVNRMVEVAQEETHFEERGDRSFDDYDEDGGRSYDEEDAYDDYDDEISQDSYEGRIARNYNY